MIRNPGGGWADLPDFPKAARAALDAGFVLHTTRLLTVQRSSDGETTKLLVQLQDGLQVEAVVMQYDNTGGWVDGWVAAWRQRWQGQRSSPSGAGGRRRRLAELACLCCNDPLVRHMT